MNSNCGCLLHAMALCSIVGALGICLLGCGAHFAPIKPLEKGEFQQGIGIQLMPGSLINYGAAYGLTDHLEVGGQAGLLDVGVRARLHAPVGRASSVSLTNGFLAVWEPSEEDHAHLRWEGRLGYIHASPWFQYAMGPTLQIETVLPDRVRVWEDRYVPKVGAFVSFGTPRVVWEFDWSINYNAESEMSEPDPYGPGAQEVAVKLSWFWGDKVEKAAPEDPFADFSSAPMAPAVPVDDVGRFGAALCRAPQAEFMGWMSQSPANRQLAETAQEANRKRMSRSKGSAGGGAVVMLLGGALFFSGLWENAAADYRRNIDKDTTRAVQAQVQSRSSPGMGGMVVGGGLFAVGTWMTARGAYLALSSSREERALRKAYPNRPTR